MFEVNGTYGSAVVALLTPGEWLHEVGYLLLLVTTFCIILPCLCFKKRKKRVKISRATQTYVIEKASVGIEIPTHSIPVSLSTLALDKTTQSRINILPPDVAADMKWCSWRASWHCSNTRKGYQSDAERDKDAFYNHADAFKQKTTRIFSTDICDNIKWMFWNMAWHTANTRWNYTSDAAKDKERAEKHYMDIIDSKEMTEELASNIKEMGWYAAWHCANTRVGYMTDAKSDKKEFEFYSRKITGGV